MRLGIRLVAGAAALLVAGACGGKKEASPRESAAPSQAQKDAEVLGRELFDLMDQSMAYRSSHQGGLPRALAEIGVESLTPRTVRRIVVTGDTPTITVLFRRTDGRGVTSCSGTKQVLEDASMNSGAFPVECTLPSGEVRSIMIGPEPLIP
jgi:hypothetical protein